MRTKIDVRIWKNLRETVNFFGNTDETDKNIDERGVKGTFETDPCNQSQEPGRAYFLELAEQVFHVFPRKRFHKSGIIGNDVFGQCPFLFL